jgi:hypothetical protein
MYAALHDEDSGSTVGDWLTNRFLTRGPEVARARYHCQRGEPERNLDHGISGPDLPLNEMVRRRFFGEE